MIKKLKNKNKNQDVFTYPDTNESTKVQGPPHTAKTDTGMS